MDNLGRVVDQIWSDYGSTPGTVDGYSYAYNNAGNLTSRANELDSALDEIYGYDGLNQLTSATEGGTSTQSWTLDSLGNWSSFDNDGSTQTRTTNADNEITATTGIATPTYDLAGNEVSTPKPGDTSSSWTVTYDAWNRVVAVTDGTTTVNYSYDGTSRLIEETTGGTTVHNYYDNQQVIETRLPDGEGGLQTSQQYVWSLAYVDAPILRDTYSGGVLNASARLYYLTDANHNVTAVVNPSGVVQERYDYDAYGNVTIYNAGLTSTLTTSAVGNTLLFAGQFVDPFTGLQFSEARWYNPSTGTFVSQDPLGYQAGDMNIYRYVGNDPTSQTDPSGECSKLSKNIGHILQGVTDITIGIAAMGFTGGLSLLLAAKGLDELGTGVYGVATGSAPDTLTSKGFQLLGCSQTTANNIDLDISLVADLALGVGGSLAAGGLIGGGAAGLGGASEAIDGVLAEESGALGAGAAEGESLANATGNALVGESAGAQTVGSGLIGDIQPASFVREVSQGENISDLVNELKQLTFQSRTPELPLGLEHGIVSLEDGSRWIVSGGEAGIDFNSIDDLDNLIVHTHGVPTGPSTADFNYLNNNGQQSSYIIELGNPNIIHFYADGTYSEIPIR